MTLPGGSVLSWEPKPLGNSSRTGIHTRYFLLTLWHFHLGWKSLRHLWGVFEIRAERTSQGTRGSSCGAKREEKTHPKSEPCSFPGSLFQSLTLTLMPAAGMSPHFIPELQGTSSMNHFCSAETADTSLKMSIFGLTFGNNNTLKQQVIPNHWEKL